MIHSNQAPGLPRSGSHWRHRVRWKAWMGMALAILAAAIGIIYVIHQANLRADLIRADPDAIPNDAALARFAVSYARPAYANNCASCHGERMQGNRVNGVPDLTDADWLYGEGRVAQIEHTILYGIRAGNGKTWNAADMPAFARPVPYTRYKIEPLEPGDIRDVTEFLLAAGGKESERAAAERGAKIFNGKGQCFDCHEEDAKGDSAIGAPNLVDNIWLYGNGTFEDIYDSIAHGRHGSCPAWFETLSPVTIRALAVLIYLESHKSRFAATVRSSAQPAGQTE